MGQVRVYADAAELAQAAAGKIAQRIVASVGVGGRCSLALSGGHTPITTFQALAAGPWVGAERWRAVDVYFADERAVPPDHPESNYAMARATLIDPAGIPARLVRERDWLLDRAAARLVRDPDVPRT